MYVKTQTIISRSYSNKYTCDWLKTIIRLLISYGLTDLDSTIFGCAVYKLLCFLVWKPFYACVLKRYNWTWITAGKVKLQILLSRVLWLLPNATGQLNSISLHIEQ